MPAGTDWNGIRIFLAVADRQSFRQAAVDLGCSQSTVKLGIERLEDQLGFRLFYRDVGGARLTAEGRQLAASARQVEQSVSDLWRVAQSAADTMAGSVTVAVTEGIGTFWLMPQLVDFLGGRGRDVRVNLQGAVRSVDVLRLEADISVQVIEPTAPELVKRKLGVIHLRMFAGRVYAERHGLPRSVAELADHRIVAKEAEPFPGYGLAEIFSPEIAERIVRLRTDLASARYWAVARGAGLGMLPNYVAAIGGDVVPVEIELAAALPIWLAVHPEVVRTARHRAVVDWLVDCFSPQRFPWFGDAPLHPREIEPLVRASKDMRIYFEGFASRLLLEDAMARPS